MEAPLKIAVLQRGWVFIGRFSQEGEQCKLTNAACIRIWGTKSGIGEIAAGGPTKNTVLDRCPDVNFHVLTAILVMDCTEARWKGF